MPIIEDGDSEPSRAQEFAQAVMDQLGDNSVVVHFGRKYLAHNDQLRRIVWIPIGGEIGPPRQAGSRRLGASEPARVLSTAAQCVETIEAHIYAEGIGRTEQLKDGLIAAMSSVGPAPSVTLARYAWVSQEADESGDTNRTEKIVLAFTLLLPVPEKFEPLRQVTGFTDVCGTIQSDGSVAPQS